jgi:hypothetical protein
MFYDSNDDRREVTRMGTEVTKLTKVTNTTTQTGALLRETVDG